jgi:hypothetical protein
MWAESHVGTDAFVRPASEASQANLISFRPGPKLELCHSEPGPKLTFAIPNRAQS